MDALPTNTGRNLNPAIAAAEALQLIGAFSSPALMLRISPRFKAFMDENGFHGAYGSRIRHQGLHVVSKLRQDDGSRQAVITLWDPVLDNQLDRHDYPCTIALQYQIEDGKLCANTIMRSNDAWLGLPYDMFQFTQLQMTLARTLGLAYGWYRHTALSMHIYADDVPLVDDVVVAHQLRGVTFPTSEHVSFQPHGIGLEEMPLSETMKRARRLSIGSPLTAPTLSESWYARVLTSFVTKEPE